jgi:hypothetical protein
VHVPHPPTRMPHASHDPQAPRHREQPHRQ